MKKHDLLACMSQAELNQLVGQTRTKEKGKQIAFDVLVTGEAINSVAQKYNVSEQWVIQLCNRIRNLKNSANSVKISVTLPASIVPQAQLMLTGLKQVYESGLNNKDNV